jgi:hypothetical protein
MAGRDGRAVTVALKAILDALARTATGMRAELRSAEAATSPDDAVLACCEPTKASYAPSIGLAAADAPGGSIVTAAARLAAAASRHPRTLIDPGSTDHVKGV